MKRIVALSIMGIMIVMLMAPMAFADTFKITEISPENGTTGAPVDNFGIKVYFSEDIYTESFTENNKKYCRLIEINEEENEDGEIIEKDGKSIDVLVVANPKEPNMMMILAEGEGDDGIQSDTLYRFEIDEGFQSADGSLLAEKEEVVIRVQNTTTTMAISMGMMAVMMVGMIYFTTRSAKKEAEKKGNEKQVAVNPYKEAKATGKSVEEIVAREAKKKLKQDEKKKRQKEENKVEIASDNVRVSKPRPISAAGAKYVHPVKKKVAEKKEKSNNSNTNKKNNNKKKGKKK